MLLTRGVLLLHDNTGPNTVRVTQNLLVSFRWDVVDFSDLAPSDYYLFTKLKFSGGQRFPSDEEVNNF